MTKADIAERIAATINFTKKESSDIVELVFELMKKTLETEGKLKISCFGVFEVKQKTARKGRNPVTGEAMTITSRRVLTFKPSAILKNVVNKGTK
jgi:integration host factor subunit alpha